MPGPGLNSRRRGESILLVTFCNVRRHAPSLAAIDLSEPARTPSWIPIRGGVHLRGARGLCAWGDLVCVAHESGLPDKANPPPGFVLLDPGSGFAQVGEGALPSTPHSVCARDGDLFLTLANRDSVFRATPRGDGWEADVHWTLPGSSGRQDTNHVNAIDVVEGRLCISATGKRDRSSDLWASVKRGYVLDIEAGRHLMHDLKHPHSLLHDGEDTWTCETRGSRVVSTGGREYAMPGDRTWRVRGLAVTEDVLYVGVSKNRLGSLSKGTLEGYEGVCRIYRVLRRSGACELLVDLSGLRNEIYELMLIG